MQTLDIIRQNPIYILWFWLGTTNLTAFFAMGIDKYKAVHYKWRIPEKNLFLLAAIGGSVGGIAGIYIFRHKTLHKKFIFGFPAILILQTVIGILIFSNLK